MQNVIYLRVSIGEFAEKLYAAKAKLEMEPPVLSRADSKGILRVLNAELDELYMLVDDVDGLHVVLREKKNVQDILLAHSKELNSMAITVMHQKRSENAIQVS